MNAMINFLAYIGDCYSLLERCQRNNPTYNDIQACSWIVADMSIDLDGNSRYDV